MNSHRGRLVVQAWLGSRLLLAALAVLVAVTTGRTFEQIVGNWDVQHFLAIATDGYAARNDIAFFPGLPILLRIGMTLGIPGLVAGVVISLIASAVAAAALYRLGGPWAAIAWLFAPTAVFGFVGYTESVFCATAFWSWERARNGRWRAAAVLAAAACTFRVSGLFLVGALALLAWTTHGPWRQRVRNSAWLLLPVSVIAAYATYLQQRTGSWTAWYEAQARGWSRGFTWPWESFLNTWPTILPGAYPDHPEWAWVFRGEMTSMLVGVAALLVLWLKRRWAEGAYVGTQVLAFSLSYWFMSVNRAVLLWFPVWILIGETMTRWDRQRSEKWLWALVGAAALVDLVVMCWWAWLFFNGRWAS